MSGAAIASAALKARVRRPSMHSKVVHPEDLMKLFPNGSYIGWSGFTGVGYPKYVKNSTRGANGCQTVATGPDS